MRAMLPTIRQDDNSTAVRIAKLLIGFEPADDNFSAEFTTYVAEWQSKHGCGSDGVIGDKTWEAIAKAMPLVSARINRKTNYAKAIQLLVGADADGIFGTKTKVAVKAFQSSHNLKADGIVGPNTWTVLITGESAKPDEGGGTCPNIQPPNFKQYDSRWGSKMYSNHNDKSQTMKSSACGPSSMADIVAQWWDKNATPWTLAQKSMEWGTRTYNSGTSSTFFRKCADLYKASKYQTSSNIDTVKKCLDAGGYVIVCFGPGTSGKAGYKKWTKGG